ncbi:hypothetical protein PINS_up000436 [Pythium insidiosum]|nr:hypothetical protein PINS_up000436 [Pythium insidiosum]
MFYCDEIGKSYFMSRDKSNLCYHGPWLYYLPLTIFLLVFWVAGVPLLFWILIFSRRRKGVDYKLMLLDDPSQAAVKARIVEEMRQEMAQQGVHIDDEKLRAFERDLLATYLCNKKLKEPSMIAQVGFIYHSYKHEYWWFEVWDLGRKLCLNCIIGLLAKTGANRIIAGLVVFLIYLSVVLFAQPFKDGSDSTLAGVTQIQLFITLFCGLILKMGSVQLEVKVISLLTRTAFFTNVGTIVFAVCSIIYEKVDATRTARRRNREEHRIAVQEQVQKLWRKAYGYALTEVYLRDDTIRPMPYLVMIELARRNREAQLEQDVVQDVDRTSYVEPITEGDGGVSPSQIDMEDIARHSHVDTTGNVQGQDEVEESSA